MPLALAACGPHAPVVDDEVLSIQALNVETWAVDANETRERALTEDDYANAQDFYSDTFSMTVNTGTTVRLIVSSEEFDTTLQVTGVDGLSLYNDDYWDGTNSMVQFQAMNDEPYVVTVSSFAPGGLGAYQIETVSFFPGNFDAVLPLGERVEGSLNPDGGPDSTGTTAEFWFEATPGQRIELRVTSPDFDTTAHLYGPTGQHWENDDANDTGENGDESNLDSTINAVAGAGGWYQLVVAPYGGSAVGDFAVRSTVGAPITVAPGSEIPDTGYAGTETEGRIFGIYAGITNYGPGNELYGCADDATHLAQAFRQRRLQAAEDQIVLTDKHATMANFTEAMERTAERAGPDDVVVIFFSGHGGILNAIGDDELDGTDETLVFVDHQMRDNDFAELVDLFEVNTVMVAIDACQSGGFARDIMTQPGRIGLFSSDEDVLSSTAEPVEAGGYLSYFMMRAVLGDADARPQDTALMAGELGDYLLDSGVEFHRSMNAQGSHDPLQRIIVERGSYNWYDNLWMFPQSEDGVPFSTELCLEGELANGAEDGAEQACP